MSEANAGIRALRHPSVIAMALATLAATAMLSVMAVTPHITGRSDAEPTHDLPVYNDVPPFELIDQDGRPFSRDDLAGKVWIADFIFTRCSAVCPMMTQMLSVLQDRLREHPHWDDIRLVSISVDPQHDQPDVLREFGEQYGSIPGHWYFLTGEKPATWALSSEGFHLGVGDTPDNAAMPITHSSKFVLVDQQGRIRGYYDSFEPTEREQLLRDIDTLLEARP